MVWIVNRQDEIERSIDEIVRAWDRLSSLSPVGTWEWHEARKAMIVAINRAKEVKNIQR